MNTFTRISIGTLIALTALPAMSAIETGDYLFLYGQILNCGAVPQVIDYAEVMENGDAKFLGGEEFSVLSMTTAQIAASIARGIGEKTGREPKSLFIKVLSGDDHSNVLGLLMKLKFQSLCEKETEFPKQDFPVERYNLRLASGLASGVPPDRALQQTADSRR